MSTHLEPLERMATRGSPRGADLLIRDVAESLEGSPIATTRPQRRRGRLSGPLRAGIAAVLVLAVGLVGGWIAGSGEEASPTGVVWHRVDGPALPGMAASGPGGFIAAGLASDRGVSFSTDGASWEQTSMAGGDGALVESVFSTNEHWLVVGSNNETRRAWWSSDGQAWVQVDWPDGMADTVQQMAATGEHFFALSRDVFDEGTTLWRSPDAQTWTEIPTGPVLATSGFLEGVSGGLVYRDEDVVSLSADGTTWTTATLRTPSELGDGNVRVEAVEYFDDRWLAFIEVERVDRDPVLAVMSSADGESWVFEGIPPFGRLDGLAPGLQAIGTFGDRLVAVPTETPTSTQEDGTVTADGFVRNTGEIWSTTDASEWALELSESQQIRDVDGRMVEGRPVGIWIGLGGGSDSGDESEGGSSPEPPVKTTTAEMPDEAPDPAGLAFQAEVIEDGTVTFEEFEQAAEHWKECMEDHGVTHVEYTIDRSGGMSRSFASPSPDGAREDAISNLCDESWINRILPTLAGN